MITDIRRHPDNCSCLSCREALDNHARTGEWRRLPDEVFAATGFEDLGDISAVPPDRSVRMSCSACRVTWRGCADVFECPRCGAPQKFWQDQDSPADGSLWTGTPGDPSALKLPPVDMAVTAEQIRQAVADRACVKCHGTKVDRQGRACRYCSWKATADDVLDHMRPLMVTEAGRAAMGSDLSRLDADLTRDALRDVILDTLDGAKVKDSQVLAACIVADVMGSFEVKLMDIDGLDEETRAP